MARNTTTSSTALVFPGQGAQYVGMGRQLWEHSPIGRCLFATADEALGYALSEICFAGPAETLDTTIVAQPAILTVTVACLLVAREQGLLPTEHSPLLMAGHSMGLLSALVAAEALDFAAALRLACERGRLMQACAETYPGGMAAIVGLDRDALSSICAAASQLGTVVPANENSPGNIVISGEVAALEYAMDQARRQGARLVQRLAVSLPAHSPLMSEAEARFQHIVERTELRPPVAPLLSNISARPLVNPAELQRELCDHLSRPVRWTDMVRNAIDLGVDTFVELGPRPVLSALIRRIERRAVNVNCCEQALVGEIIKSCS
jgi:[acyl-carrier-protein] S-malonyltransferase